MYLINFFKKAYVFFNVCLSYWILKQWPSSNQSVYFSKNLLVLAPHPDDEILGLGGIILQFLKNGSKIHIVYLTDGEGSGVWLDKEEIKRQRIALSNQVCGELGISYENITRLHIPDGAVPFKGQAGYVEVVAQVQNLIDILKPDAVFATHSLDYWPYDHVACAELAKDAVQNATHTPELWYYWVWAWYNLRPWQLQRIKNSKIRKFDCSEWKLRKKELIKIYLNANTPDHKPWSGVLPKALIKALSGKYEVVEQINYE